MGVEQPQRIRYGAAESVKLTLDHPTLFDTLLCLVNVAQEEIDQFSALRGVGFDADDVAMQLYGSQGPKFCLRDDSGTAVVVAGLRRLRRGVHDTWFLVREDAWPIHGREITVRTARTMQDILASGQVHRIECYCLASREKAQRWYDTIGLKRESILERYGVNGENFALFVATREPTGETK